MWTFCVCSVLCQWSFKCESQPSSLGQLVRCQSDFQELLSPWLEAECLAGLAGPDSAEHFSYFPPVFVVPVFPISSWSKLCPLAVRQLLARGISQLELLQLAHLPPALTNPCLEERGDSASVTKLHYTTKALVSSLRIYGHLQVSILSTPYIQVHLFTVCQK